MERECDLNHRNTNTPNRQPIKADELKTPFKMQRNEGL